MENQLSYVMLSCAPTGKDLGDFKNEEVHAFSFTTFRFRVYRWRSFSSINTLLVFRTMKTFPAGSRSGNLGEAVRGRAYTNRSTSQFWPLPLFTRTITGRRHCGSLISRYTSFIHYSQPIIVTSHSEFNVLAVRCVESSRGE